MRRRGIALLLALWVGLCGADWGEWQAVGGLVVPVANCSAVVVRGQLYAVGGDVAGSADGSEVVQSLSRSDWIWKKEGMKLAAPASGVTAAVAWMDQLIVVVADGASRFLESRPRVQTWRPPDAADDVWYGGSVQDSSASWRYDAAVAVFAGKVWVIGGVDASDDSVKSEVESYNILTGVWSDEGRLPPTGTGDPAGIARSAVVVVNTGGGGSLYVIGGRGSDGRWRSGVYNRTDGASNFACSLSMSEGLLPVVQPVAAAAGGNIWVIGDNYVADPKSGGLRVFVFNTDLLQWTNFEMKGMSTWRHAAPVVTWTSGLDRFGNLLLVGGEREDEFGGGVSGDTSVTPTNDIPTVHLSESTLHVGDVLQVRVLGVPGPLVFRLASTLSCELNTAGTSDRHWEQGMDYVTFTPAAPGAAYLCYTRGYCAAPGSLRVNCDLSVAAIRSRLVSRGASHERVAAALATTDPQFACQEMDCCFDNRSPTPHSGDSWQCFHPTIKTSADQIMSSSAQPLQDFIPLLLGEALQIEAVPTPAPATPAPPEPTPAPETPHPATPVPDTPVPETPVPATPAPHTPA
eukprot:Hpha_TRINITY_DN22253_c0_g1::TRINITY_DN22253_c0_g1_i1::g.167269::m.167269